MAIWRHEESSHAAGFYSRESEPAKGHLRRPNSDGRTDDTRLLPLLAVGVRLLVLVIQGRNSSVSPLQMATRGLLLPASLVLVCVSALLRLCSQLRNPPSPYRLGLR